MNQKNSRIMKNLSNTTENNGGGQAAQPFDASQNPQFIQEANEPQASQKPKSGTSARGFASMSKDKVREIASKGGRAAHECGKAHRFSAEEARLAGRKGGLARANNH
jgi:general stress protein YciG